MRPSLLLAAALCLAFHSPSARAFTESTYVAVAINSLRLAPPGLARIADRERKQLIEGARAPLVTEGGAEHLAAPRGVAEQRVKEQTDRIIELIGSHTPFSAIAFELGVLCHYVTDLDNPLNTARSDPRHDKIRRDFEAYVERSMPKFVLTFDGHRSSALAQGDVKGFAEEVAKHSAHFAPYLTRSYFPEGAMVTSRTFDDRHTAFGVASLSYQNAIGDCARLYVYVWRQVNGDLRGTPFIDDDWPKASRKLKGPR